MKNLGLAIIIVCFCGSAHAQPKKTLVDIEQDFKQANSSSNIAGIVEDLSQAVPETEADVAALGRLMNAYPDISRKTVLNIKDQKLASVVMRECKREIIGLKLDKEKDWKTLPKEERQRRFDGLQNVYAYMSALGNLKNKEAVPFLKQYVTPTYYGVLSYNASQALGLIGDEAVMDEMIRDIDKTRNIDLSAFGDKAFVKIIKELDAPAITNERKAALINQIKGSANPERKKVLKELALGHKDRWVRDRSGLALLNSMLVNPEEGDKEFIKRWVKATKNTETGYWAVVSIRTSHKDGREPLGSGFAEITMDVLKTSARASTRSEAADILGMYKVRESLPQLEECVTKDIDAHVRGGCCYAYWEITGKVTANLHPDDVAEQKARFSNPETIKFYDKLSDTHQSKRFYLALKRAVEEYDRQHE